MGPGSPERGLRLAFCGLSCMVADLVRTVLPEAQVVAEIDPSGDLRRDFERSGADVLVCALPEDRMQALWRDSLERHPLYAVLNLSDGERDGQLYAVHPERRTARGVDAASLAGLLEEHARRLRAAP